MSFFVNQLNNKDIQKDYIIDLRNIHAAKRENDQMLRSSSCQGAKMEECVAINQELDKELHRLQTLKQMYNLKDFVEPDDMYLLDPSDKSNRSKYVKYSPNMFNINVGVPTCNTSGCNTTADELFQINPNVKDNFKAYEEQYMLFPKSNIVTPKWAVEQKQQLKIYPHMFSDTYNLMKEQERSDSEPGGIAPGGVDYPIPMRFQMKYLQQPAHKGMGQNIDYDIHIRSKNKNLPQWHDKIMSKDLNLRKQDDIQQNRQRIINVGYPGDNFTPPPVIEHNTPLTRQRIASELDLVAQSASVSRNEIRKAANNVDRIYGFYPTEDPEFNLYDGDLQTEREEQHAREIMNQPLDWYKYKGVPRSATTMTEKEYKNMLNSRGSEKIVRAKGPSAAAQRSGFFEYGPPIPPPNPELLSAIPSEMLVNRTRLATLKDTSGFKVPIPQKRDEYLLKTDLEQSIKPFKLTDGEIGHLFRPPGPGVDQPRSLDVTQRSSTQRSSTSSTTQPKEKTTVDIIENFDQLPVKWTPPNKELQCGNKPNPNTVEFLQEMWFAKELALQRIKFQIAHLERLEPKIRQKQIQAKEVSHTINMGTGFMNGLTAKVSSL